MMREREWRYRAARFTSSSGPARRLRSFYAHDVIELHLAVGIVLKKDGGAAELRYQSGKEQERRIHCGRKIIGGADYPGRVEQRLLLLDGVQHRFALLAHGARIGRSQHRERKQHDSTHDIEIRGQVRSTIDENGEERE